MISNKLRNLFLLSLVLIYAHGVEEVLTGFQYSDSFMVFGASFFNTTPETFYWIFHIIWWILVPILFLLFRKTKLVLPLLSLYGLVFITELHHIIKGLIAVQYYPGMITSIFYPVLGFFYWKELLKNWQRVPR